MIVRDLDSIPTQIRQHAASTAAWRTSRRMTTQSWQVQRNGEMRDITSDQSKNFTSKHRYCVTRKFHELTWSRSKETWLQIGRDKIECLYTLCYYTHAYFNGNLYVPRPFGISNSFDVPDYHLIQPELRVENSHDKFSVLPWFIGNRHTRFRIAASSSVLHYPTFIRSSFGSSVGINDKK